MPAAYEAQCDLLIKKSYTGHEQQLERGGGDSGYGYEVANQLRK